MQNKKTESDKNMQQYDFTKQPSILIQGAMEIETDYLIGQLEDAVCAAVGNWKFYTGFLGRYREPVIVSRTYQGMVNASADTTLGLTYFAPKAVINQGIAGGHDKDIHLGEIVIGERVVPMGAVMQEFRAKGIGIDPLGFEALPLEIYDKVKQTTAKMLDFPCDKELIEAAERVQTDIHMQRGVLGSADEWNNQIDWIAVMRERYQTSSEDMESAAVAQICRSYGVPFIGIRIISNSVVNGEDFDESVALCGQKYIQSYIEELHGFRR